MISWLEELLFKRPANREIATGHMLDSQTDNNEFSRIAKFLLDKSSEIVFWTDDSGNFLDCNDATCQVFGYSRDELKTMKVADIDPEITTDSHKRLLRTLEENQRVVVQTRPFRKDGSSTTLEFSVERLMIDGKLILIAYGNEIDLEKLHRNRVWDSIANGRPLSETLLLIVELAEKTRIQTAGSILVLDDFNCLRNGASRQLSDDYSRWIESLGPAPTAGAGEANPFAGESVMIEDVLAKPVLAGLKEFAQSEEIRACWWEPIFSSTQELLGTFALYHREVCKATDVDRGLMKSFARFAGIAIDRDRENQKLRTNENRYRTLIDSTTTTVWTTNPKGEFVSRQESWERYTGQPWEEHQGIGWKNALHPDDQERLISEWTESMATDCDYKSYGRVWHAPTNEFRHFIVHGAPVFVDGAIVEWSGCLIDVHDKENAIKALQQNERQLRAITDSLPVCIGHINKQYQYEFSNAMYQAYFGLSEAEIRGKTVKEVVGDAGFLEAKPHLDAALAGETVSFERRLDVAGVGYRTREIRLVPNKNLNGDVIGIFVLADDITERRALEKEVLNIAIKQQQRMGQDLHDGMGQELTGLGMIADTLTLALRNSRTHERRIAEKLAVGIKRALGHVKSLARGLNPVDISSAGIQSALTEMAQHVEDLYGISCSVDCNSEIEFEDDQISTNLFRIAQEATTNAAKHGKARIVTIKIDKSQLDIELSIVDDGCGFDVKNNNSRGMGLRTMEYRAGVIGAQIQIISIVNEGTRISCQVPKQTMTFPPQSHSENGAWLVDDIPKSQRD